MFRAILSRVSKSSGTIVSNLWKHNNNNNTLLINNQASFSPFTEQIKRTFLTTSFLFNSSSSTTKQQYTPYLSTPNPGNKKQWDENRFLLGIHKAGPKPPRIKRHPLNNKPQMKGVVLKTLIRKPKKPNSANRKCVLVRLSNGNEITAFVPGEGHNLQEHSVVLVHKKRVRDVPGLKIRVIRGAHDCAHVSKDK